MNMYQDVLEFHEKFVPDAIPENPRMLPADLFSFRLRFLSEELLELAESVGRYDIEDAADALVDLVYVALGTSVMMGLPWGEIWKAVHEANMKKVRVEAPEKSKRGSQYDVVKPEGWKAPDLLSIIYAD